MKKIFDDLSIDDLIKIVTENKCEIQIEIRPEGTQINITPWEPFHYDCPFR